MDKKFLFFHKFFIDKSAGEDIFGKLEGFVSQIADE